MFWQQSFQTPATKKKNVGKKKQVSEQIEWLEFLCFYVLCVQKVFIVGTEKFLV